MGGAHHFIDAQGENQRMLVALDGRIKLVLLTAALVLNLTAGGVRTPLCLAVLALILVRISGVRASAFLKRMAVPAVLATVAFITQLFWFQEGPPLLSFPLLSFELTVYQGGVWRGLELASRILGGMGVLLFFSLTTPLPELMRAARFFRCPPVLVELALIMYRYIFLLLEEGGRIRNARHEQEAAAPASFAAELQAPQARSVDAIEPGQCRSTVRPFERLLERPQRILAGFGPHQQQARKIQPCVRQCRCIGNVRRRDEDDPAA
jgi:cobalt/nickel transport system permease protein